MNWLTFGNGFKFGLGFSLAYFFVKGIVGIISLIISLYLAPIEIQYQAIAFMLVLKI